jgi:NAD(P)-dependent dehydrogenase (short-subunit alcohol dehydrogenase family)
MAKVLIIGATRGVGLETVRAALRAGPSVRALALARSAASVPIRDTNLDKVPGNALDRDTVRNALQDVERKLRRRLSRQENGYAAASQPLAPPGKLGPSPVWH